LDEFGKVIVALESGGVGPQLKRLTRPEKLGKTIPTGKLIVRTSVSLAVLVPQTLAVLVLLALIKMANVPTALAVPEISPGVQPSELLWQTVNPPGNPTASKVSGRLSAVI